MQKNKNRQGLALGAMVSLVASLFVGVAPAQAAVTILPTEGTSYDTLIGETFSIKFVADASKPIAVKVTPVGHEDLYNISVSSDVLSASPTSTVKLGNATNGTLTVANALSVSNTAESTTAYVTSYSSLAVNTLEFNVVDSQSAALTSASPLVSVTVQIWEDLFADGLLGTGETAQSVTITFHPWSVLDATVSLTQPHIDDTFVTASATVTGVNFEQLAGGFYFQLGGDTLATPASFSDAIYGADATPGTPAATAIGTGDDVADGIVLSASMTVPVMSTVSQSVSAQLFYAQDGNAASVVTTEALAPRVTKQIAALTYDGLTLSPVVGVNLDQTGATAANARVNSSFQLKSYAYTGSAETGSAVSGVATSLYFAFNAGGFDAGESITVNGVTYTSSSELPDAADPIVLPAGLATVTVTTAGMNADEVITFTNVLANIDEVVTVTLQTPSFVLDNNGDHDTYFAAPGGSVALSFTVEDQFGVKSDRTNQRVVATVELGGSVSSTVSASVVAGVANLTVTPVPATRTGSAEVTLTLQTQNLGTGLWDDDNDTATVTINVSSLANAFVSRTASESASISYDVTDDEYEWSDAIELEVVNSYSMVTATAAGLYIQSGDEDALGTLTAQADQNGEVSFNFTGTVAGTYTVTFTNGTATTTSQVIIDPASGEAGHSVTVTAPASAVAGKAIEVTVSVKDLYGNPVDTATASQLTLEASGVGFFLGGGRTQTSTTNANGEATFTLTSDAAASGNLTLTASYDGTADTTSTAVVAIAAPVVATAQTVSVVASAASVEAGRNADVTITVTDTAGNAHAYKSVVVYSTGAGYLSAQTVTTDGEGKAVVKLITSANDSGTATITASVDGKSGTATVTVAAPVVEAAPEVEAVIGSFQGRWAVRVENANVGDRVVIKVGGNWYVFTYASETGSQLFSRKSSVGAEVAVTVWVNGKTLNAETITIQ